MSALEVREITREQRVEAFQQAVNHVRSAAHLLADNEVWAALDETKRCLFLLDQQLRTLKEAGDADPEELVRRMQIRSSGRSTGSRDGGRSGKHVGRRKGVDVVPGRVKQARLEAGLNLGQVAGREVTKAAICLIESGKSRPSQLTLDLIARRTGKPVEWFLADTPWNQYVRQVEPQLAAAAEAEA